MLMLVLLNVSERTNYGKIADCCVTKEKINLSLLSFFKSPFNNSEKYKTSGIIYNTSELEILCGCETSLDGKNLV